MRGEQQGRLEAQQACSACDKPQQGWESLGRSQVLPGPQVRLALGRVSSALV